MDEVDIYEAWARREHAYREASVARFECYLVKHRAKKARRVNQSKVGLRAKQSVVRGVLAASKRDAAASRLVEAEQASKRHTTMCILAATTREEMVREMLQHFARERDAQMDFARLHGVWLGSKLGWVSLHEFNNMVKEDLAHYKSVQPLKWKQLFPYGYDGAWLGRGVPTSG